MSALDRIERLRTAYPRAAEIQVEAADLDELLAIARAVRAWGDAARDADDAHIAWEAQPANISLENAHDAAWERAVAARRAVRNLAATLTPPAAQGSE